MKYKIQVEKKNNLKEWNFGAGYEKITFNDDGVGYTTHKPTADRIKNDGMAVVTEIKE